jgi:hypothetical protein
MRAIVGDETGLLKVVDVANGRQATSGCFSWFVTYPLDVVKSRMQFDIARER